MDSNGLSPNNQVLDEAGDDATPKTTEMLG
jgi:hypothetical protein